MPETLNIKVPARPEQEIAEHSLACHAFGKPSSPALFCVHGLTRNGRDFDFLAEVLSENFYVLCPDMPGRGKSAWLAPNQYNYEIYTAEIGQLLASLNITKAHWLGTSMGGVIGLSVANAYPGVIQSLILNDVGCSIPKEGLARIMAYAGVFLKFPAREKAEEHIRTTCSPFGITDEKHWQHLFTHGLVHKPDGWQLHYDPNITAMLKDAEVKDIDLWPLWEAVKTSPALLIRGMQSDILPETVAERMAQNHPNLTRYNVENAGHAPALMAERDIAFIQDWLKKKT